MRRHWVGALLVVAVAGMLLGACGAATTAIDGTGPRKAVVVVAPPVPAQAVPAYPAGPPVAVSPPSVRIVPATTAPPAFSVSVSAVTAADLGGTWHPGCPVGPDQLRLLHLGYWGFDGQPHVGAMVVNQAVVAPVTQVFQNLWNQRFPIHEMVPQAAYGGNDNAAAAADDTSGFNCRNAVVPSGPPQWSVHAYGEAIDVNDVENPYVDGATVIPPSGTVYLNRSAVRPGMALPGGTLVQAFSSVGWSWGGRWTASPDYQHFSATGG